MHGWNVHRLQKNIDNCTSSGHPASAAEGRTVNFMATRTTPSGRSRWPFTPSSPTEEVVTRRRTSAAEIACMRHSTTPPFSVSRYANPLCVHDVRCTLLINAAALHDQGPLYGCLTAISYVPPANGTPQSFRSVADFLVFMFLHSVNQNAFIGLQIKR